jgi:hypothetical protein
VHNNYKSYEKKCRYTLDIKLRTCYITLKYKVLYKINNMDTKQAELEIALIKKIMDDSRRIVAGNGKDFILWGVVVLTGVIGTYISIAFEKFTNVWWIWVVCIGFGWIYSIALHWHDHSKVSGNTLAGRIISGVWISCGIAMTLIGFLATLTGAIGAWSISPMISVVLGIGYFVSGIIYGQKWIRNLSFGWWIGAIIMFIWPGSQTLLIFALMMVMLQIVPGVVLYYRWKKEVSVVPNG